MRHAAGENDKEAEEGLEAPEADPPSKPHFRGPKPDMGLQPSSADDGASSVENPAAQGNAGTDKELIEYGGQKRSRTDMSPPTGQGANRVWKTKEGKD